MSMILFEETMEEELRKKYNVPPEVSSEELHAYIGKELASASIDEVFGRMDSDGKESVADSE